MKICIFLLITAVTSVWADTIQHESSSSTKWQWQIGQESPFRANENRSWTNITEPQPNTGSTQQKSDDVPVLLNQQPHPATHTPSASQSGQHVDPQRESNEIQRRLSDLTYWLVVVGAMQVIIIIFQLLYGARSANAAKKSAKVAEDTLRMTERAYIVVKNWGMRGSLEEVPVEIIFTFWNAGRTEATLLEGGSQIGIRDNFPPIPDYQSLREKMVEIPIPAQGEVAYNTNENPISISNEVAGQIRRREKTLYYYGSFIYQNIFEEKYEVAFFTQYNATAGQFLVVNKPGYTYHKRYRENHQ